MKLQEVLRAWEDPRARAAGVAVMRDEIRPGAVFVDVFGGEGPGVGLAEALRLGVSLYVTRRPLKHRSVVRVSNTFAAYSDLCRAYFGHPAAQLDCYGITGTKGKTTTSHLLTHLLEADGRSVALISTGFRKAGARKSANGNTTPIAFELNGWLRQAVEQKAKACVLETTSIALEQERVRGVGFKAVAFTNIGTDHLDYHGGRRAYVAQKRRLFEDPSVVREDAVRVVNIDDPEGASLRKRLGSRCVTYGETPSADYAFRVEAQSRDGLKMVIGRQRVRSPLYGTFNAQNIACAVALARELGVAWRVIRDACATFEGVPGRMQRVSDASDPRTVIVDFAHTPESVEAALQAIRSTCAGRGELTVVIGCGGERDRGKRPKIARIAAQLADRVVVTTDNSRSEAPEAIAREMLGGVPTKLLGRVCVELDRRAAINMAISGCGNDGAVAILGRGSESRQEIQGKLIEFDDREVARSVLRTARAAEGRGVAAGRRADLAGAVEHR